jgi:hypothetical protein
LVLTTTVGIHENLCSAPPEKRQTQALSEGKLSGSLDLVNESGAVTTISPESFAKLARQTVKAKDHSGESSTYEGVSLAEALRSANVSMGKELKGKLLANYILVEAADGYRVVFSLAEIDPSMSDNVVLIADRKDAKLLDAKEGPYRLVVPHDKKYARWVRQVTRISVQSAAEANGRAKGK